MALHVLKSFFKYNGITGLLLQDYEFRAIKRMLRVPTKAEVYKMATFARKPRDRAALLCLLHNLILASQRAIIWLNEIVSFALDINLDNSGLILFGISSDSFSLMNLDVSGIVNISSIDATTITTESRVPR